MKVSVMAPYRAAASMMMPQNRHIKHLLCKQKEQAPYSFVLYKDGQPHTLTTREACTSNGIETISLPAKNFPDATSLSIINIGNTDLVVSVYEVKEPHHE